MKKKLFIVLMIFFMTGCTVEYNLNIENDNFIESINVDIPEGETEQFASLTKGNQYVRSSLNSDIIYKKSFTEDDISTKYNYSHTFSLDEFRQSGTNKCFKKFRIQEEDDYYSLIAEDFNCFGDFEAHADKYKINIKTDYIVLNNNADVVKNNTYTWNIDKKNYKKKSIIFQYSKKEKKVSIMQIIKPLLISLVIATALLVLVVITRDYIKKQKTEM